MPNAKFNLVQDNGDSQMTLYHEDETHLADSSHPRWDDIYRLVVVEDNPAEAVELFDVTRLLRRLVVSERVTVTFNAVLFDNDPVNDALAEHIVRLVNEGEEVGPWVKLLENIKLNPNPGSVEQLYRHLSRHQYTITQDGLILAYKGVNDHRACVESQEDGVYYSTRSGHAIVNGTEVNDYVAQKVGDVVEMPRSEVTYDPNVTCSTGLHVADWGYAKRMGNTVLAVLVNPRDVVSVPTDYSDAKVRVCRYKVLEARTEPYEGAVLRTEVSVEVKPSEPTELVHQDANGEDLHPGDHVSHVNGDEWHIGVVLANLDGHVGSGPNDWREGATTKVTWFTTEGLPSHYNARAYSRYEDENAQYEYEHPDCLYKVEEPEGFSEIMLTDLADIMKLIDDVEAADAPFADAPFKKGDRVYYYDESIECGIRDDGGYDSTGTVLDVAPLDDIAFTQSFTQSTHMVDVDWDCIGTIDYPDEVLRLIPDDSSADDESASETTQENEVSATATPTRYRYPSPAKFDEIVAAAKRQKKGVRRFIESRTNWSLIEGRGDGSERKDWQV